jgi:hypothetical protein
MLLKQFRQQSDPVGIFLWWLKREAQARTIMADSTRGIRFKVRSSYISDTLIENFIAYRADIGSFRHRQPYVTPAFRN